MSSCIFQILTCFCTCFTPVWRKSILILSWFRHFTHSPVLDMTLIWFLSMFSPSFGPDLDLVSSCFRTWVCVSHFWFGSVLALFCWFYSWFRSLLEETVTCCRKFENKTVNYRDFSVFALDVHQTSERSNVWTTRVCERWSSRRLKARPFKREVNTESFLSLCDVSKQAFCRWRCSCDGGGGAGLEPRGVCQSSNLDSGVFSFSDEAFRWWERGFTTDKEAIKNREQGFYQTLVLSKTWTALGQV